MLVVLSRIPTKAMTNLAWFIIDYWFFITIFAKFLHSMISSLLTTCSYPGGTSNRSLREVVYWAVALSEMGLIID